MLLIDFNGIAIVEAMFPSNGDVGQQQAAFRHDACISLISHSDSHLGQKWRERHAYARVPRSVSPGSISDAREWPLGRQLARRNGIISRQCGKCIVVS